MMIFLSTSRLLFIFFIISITADEKMVCCTRGIVIKKENYVVIGLVVFVEQKQELGFQMVTSISS